MAVGLKSFGKIIKKLQLLEKKKNLCFKAKIWIWNCVSKVRYEGKIV